MKSIFRLAFLLCTATLLGQQEYSVLSIPKELIANTNSVVLDELIEVDVTNIAKMITKKRKVVAILNKRGDGDIDLKEFYSSNSRVRNIEARIYDAFGKEINRFKKKNFTDVSRTGNNMYMDARVLFLNYTPTSYPYIVVFESEVESGDSAFIDSWLPLTGYAESTQKSVYKIKFDPSNKPRYKARNLEGYDITIEETPSEIVFSASTLEAINYEEQSPSGTRIFPHIIVALDKFYLKGTLGYASDWKEFGVWMEKDLLADVGQIPDGTLSRVRNLVAHATTNEEKARIVYKFVQDKVRYISVQIGIGGWKPMPAADVDKLSYGDCKALTNYTKALLDAVGVPSYYTVLYGDRYKRDILDDFASVQGNHVILGVPNGNKITWLECTSQDTPYGYIGRFTDDRDVLILTPEGGEIVRTKTYDSEENIQKNNAVVTVSSNGSVKAEFEGVSTGIQYEDKYLIPKKKSEDIDSFYKNRWSHINGFSISDINFIDDVEHIEFTETLVLKIPNYANAVGSDFLFCPNIFNQNIYIPPRIEDRKQNLYIDRGFVDIDTVEVEIPENFKVEMLPESTVLETPFGKYEIEFSQVENSKLRYTRNLHITKGDFPPSEYENYRDFLRTIARLDRTKVLLKQSAH